MTADTARARRVAWKGGATTHPPRGAARALFVNEAIRALRHPVTVAAVALQIALWLYEYLDTAGSGRFAVMTDADHATQVPMMLLLGSAAFLTGNFAVIRSARFRTDSNFGIMPLSPWKRTSAVLLSSVALGAVSFLLTVVHVALQQVSPIAAGSANLREAVAGPLVVLMMGFGGVLIGQFFVSPVVAPLTLLSLGAVMAIASFPLGLGASRLRWLLPVAIDDVTAFPMPGSLLDRPAGLHLLYIAGLALVLYVAALMPKAARRGVVGGITAVLVLTTAVPGYAQLSGPSQGLLDARTQATRRPAAQQICTDHNNVTFCGFAQFKPWFPDWQRVTDGVLAQIPGDLPRLYLRQRVFIAGRAAGGTGLVPEPPVADWELDDKQAGTPDSISIGTTWGTGAGELELAVSVAARVVMRDATSSTKPICGGRAIAILWVAGHADARALHEMESQAKNGSGDLIVMTAGFNSSGPAFNREDLSVALLLLSQHDREPRTELAQWNLLTDPETSTTDAAKQLGVAYSGGSELGKSWC